VILASLRIAVFVPEIPAIVDLYQGFEVVFAGGQKIVSFPL